MNHLTVLGAAVLTAIAPLHLNAQVRYEISFPNAVHHEAVVSVTFDGLSDAPLEVRMSRSSPGRYALHEFAKNVYNVRVTGSDGKPLGVTRPNPYQWTIPEHGPTVNVRYTLFANRAGGTYSQVNETHAHLNMPATFMWARGHDGDPIRITFHIPEGSQWKIATQLFPTDDPSTFTAPGLQYFMDSPTEISNFAMREWTVTANGASHRMRMAVHHLGTGQDVDSYVAMAKKVVAEEIAVYGETPEYDVGYYTFIADYLPWASGDGMEHRNSTIMTSAGNLARNAMRLLGTVSHEFFHSWNVERIRPATLEPFDFERANMSRELWFAEGFTSYYTPLFIRRAGLMNDDQYAARIAGAVNFVVNSPARRFFSAVEMSMQAPFVDAATSIDPTNRNNTFISYYTWGTVIGLNLDLTLRSRYSKTLDDFMRMAWTRYGRTEHPYTVEDLEQTLGEFTGDAAFAHEFFNRYVRGREVPDYTRLLAPAGFLLRLRNPGKVVLDRVRFGYSGGGAVIQSNTTIGMPLYEAGLDNGDRIISLDGSPVTDRSTLARILERHKPGDTVSIEYEQHAVKRTGSVTFIQDPSLEIVTYESQGMELTDRMRRFRDSWLGSRAN